MPQAGTRCALPIIALAALLLMVAPAAAGEAGLTWRPPEDVVLFWAKKIGVIVAALSILLVLCTLVVHRNRLMAFRARWLLFFGLCALPLPVLFLSVGVGMEQSKEVAFCSHCHVMDPFIDDMRDPGSATLASLHYQNRYIQKNHCWSCHSDYGIFGSVEAKISGLSHVYNYSAENYDLPVKLRHDYNFGICLYCHAESAKYQEAHASVAAQILEMGGACMKCHQRAHPAREERSREP
jgi:cytochrome c nitrite reductase small subunit